MGQIQTTTALVLIGLFSVAILTFALNFATDNSAAVSIADDPGLTNLNTNVAGNVSGFDTGSQNTYSSIVNATLEPGSGSAPSVGPFAITPGNALFVVKNILSVGYVRIFGSNNGFGIFLTAFVAILVFIMALYLYKTVRGFPD